MPSDQDELLNLARAILNGSVDADVGGDDAGTSSNRGSHSNVRGSAGGHHHPERARRGKSWHGVNVRRGEVGKGAVSAHILSPIELLRATATFGVVSQPSHHPLSLSSQPPWGDVIEVVIDVRDEEDAFTCYTCPICLASPLDRAPVVTPCGHIYCYPCWLTCVDVTAATNRDKAGTGTAPYSSTGFDIGGTGTVASRFASTTLPCPICTEWVGATDVTCVTFQTAKDRLRLAHMLDGGACSPGPGVPCCSGGDDSVSQLYNISLGDVRHCESDEHHELRVPSLSHPVAALHALAPACRYYEKSWGVSSPAARTATAPSITMAFRLICADVSRCETPPDVWRAAHGGWDNVGAPLAVSVPLGREPAVSRAPINVSPRQAVPVGDQEQACFTRMFQLPPPRAAALLALYQRQLASLIAEAREEVLEAEANTTAIIAAVMSASGRPDASATGSRSGISMPAVASVMASTSGGRVWGDRRALTGLLRSFSDDRPGGATAAPLEPGSSAPLLRAASLPSAWLSDAQTQQLAQWAEMGQRAEKTVELLEWALRKLEVRFATAMAAVSGSTRSGVSGERRPSGGATAGSSGSIGGMPSVSETGSVPVHRLYGYQSMTGDCMYLHPLTLAALQAACSATASLLPEVVIGKPLQIDLSRVDENWRRKQPVLHHLPLGNPFGLVELDTRTLRRAFVNDFGKRETWHSACPTKQVLVSAELWTYMMFRQTQRSAVLKGKGSGPGNYTLRDKDTRRVSGSSNSHAHGGHASGSTVSRHDTHHDTAHVRGELPEEVSKPFTRADLLREYMGITDLRPEAFDTGTPGGIQSVGSRAAWQSYLDSSVDGSGTGALLTDVSHFPALPPLASPPLHGLSAGSLSTQTTPDTTTSDSTLPVTHGSNHAGNLQTGWSFRKVTAAGGYFPSLSEVTAASAPTNSRKLQSTRPPPVAATTTMATSSTAANGKDVKPTSSVLAAGSHAGQSKGPTWVTGLSVHGAGTVCTVAAGSARPPAARGLHVGCDTNESSEKFATPATLDLFSMLTSGSASKGRGRGGGRRR